MQSAYIEVSPKDLREIAREAVAVAKVQHADALEATRAFLVADDAAYLAGREIAARQVPALGVVAHVAPAGYWERIAAPAVAAVLAEDATPAPCPAQDNAPAEITSAAVIAALEANGGRLEGDFADVVKALRSKTTNQQG